MSEHRQAWEQQRELRAGLPERAWEHPELPDEWEHSAEWWVQERKRA